jgi:hypothetical protein
MNGDGCADLLGSWTGQGVYYRNSASGAWVLVATPATKITAGDLDGDGTDDLVGIWPSQGGVWTKYSGTGSWASLSTTADWIACGKMRAAGATSLGSLESPGVTLPGPDNAAWVVDDSSTGPGGKDFNPDASGVIGPVSTDFGKARVPGPGEPGFRCTRQANLIPGLRKDIRDRK